MTNKTTNHNEQGPDDHTATNHPPTSTTAHDDIGKERLSRRPRRIEAMTTTPHSASLPTMAPTPRAEAALIVNDLGTILGVWAHPDDEAFLSAGLMRLALENGQRVTCVTATKGELGTNDPFTWPPDQLAPARSVELTASLASISGGLDGQIEHHWLDHRDGRCADIRPAIGAAEIGRIIDRVRPDTVITFEPGGVTGHSDHQAVAEWTTLALADRPAVRQLEAVVPQSYVEYFDGRLDLDPFFYEGYPDPVDDEQVCLNLVLDDQLWEIKDRALRAQATQTDALIALLGAELWKEFNLVEAFIENIDWASRS